MTNPLQLIRDLDAPIPRERTQPLKSRRQRRQEQRDSEVSKAKRRSPQTDQNQQKNG